MILGYEEIVNVKENLEQNVTNMKICMLHSQLNSKEQKQAFVRFRNDRKVVLATNIAETSLTIDDVTIVIDTGEKYIHLTQSRFLRQTYRPRSKWPAVNFFWLKLTSSICRSFW